jgi:hypothetical protein
MISFFTTPKSFSGHIGVIQRNALQSWKRLDPDDEVILLGDETGSAEAARDLGLPLAGDQCCDLREATHKLTRTRVMRAIDSVRLRWRTRRMTDTFARRLKRFEKGISTKFGERRTRRLIGTSHAFRRLLKSGSPFKRHRIAIIGLGKIGFPLAVCLAHKGCTVVGIDTDVERLAALQSGRSLSPEKTWNNCWREPGAD